MIKLWSNAIENAKFRSNIVNTEHGIMQVLKLWNDIKGVILYKK